MTKKLKYNLNSKAIVVITLLILLMVNYIAARNFVRFDLTDDQTFAVSSSTQKIVKNLDDLVTIKVFFSEKLPPNIMAVYQEVRDMLSEYDAYGKNIKIEYIDPLENEEIEKEVQGLGVPPVEMNFIEKDKMEVQKGYLGIGVFYGDKKEILPVVQNTSNLEYELTSAIKKATATEVKRIGFLTGHGEHGIFEGFGEMPAGDYTQIRRALEKNYEVTVVDVSTGEPIEDIDTLIVAGPKDEFSKRDKYEIDQFIINGGNAIFLIDMVEIGANLQASKIDPKLDTLLANYGIKVRKDLAMDSAANELVSFSKGFFNFASPYALWPRLIKAGFSKNPVVAKLEAISFAWASSLETVDKEGVDVEILAQTTKLGATQSDNFVLDPNQRVENIEHGKIDMIALASGEFESLFSGEDVPALSEEDAATETREVKKKRDDEGQIIVIGDSDFISDGLSGRLGHNMVFFLNAVDYLTLGSDLISIRSKEITDRPLKEIGEAQKGFVKGMNILGVSVLVVVLGIGRSWLRRRDRKMSMEG